MSVARFMLDTNILLQCRDLPVLPWAEVTDAELVELYPAPTALHEIDKFKTSGDRRADRARNVSARMRKVVLDPHAQLELRPRSPRLVLCLPPELSAEALDLIARQPTPDYRIVEEACASALMLEGLCLVTADTGPCVRAKQRGLAFKLVDGAWLAPPESDAKDRRITALEKQLAALTSGAPVIETTLASNRADLTRLPIHEYGQLSPFVRDALVDELTGELLKDAERAVIDELHGGFEIVNSSTRELQDYRDRLEAWREAVREELARVSPHAQIASRLHPFHLAIANKGARPAEHVKVTIEASGYVTLASAQACAKYWDAEEAYLAEARLGPPRLLISPPPTRNDADPSTFPPMAPRAKVGRYGFRRTSRDRGDESDAAIVFECDDLRHGDEPQALYFSAFLGGVHKEGEIKVTITAANLAEPLVSTTPVACIESEADIDGLAASMVRLHQSGARLNRRREG